MVRKLATYAAYFGQAFSRACSNPPGAVLSIWMLKISSVIATAKTPSLKASTRPLLMALREYLEFRSPLWGGSGRGSLAGEDAEAAGFHPGDGDAKRDEQQLDRDRGGERPARRDGWKLLAHHQRDRQRQPGRSQPSHGGDRRDGRFVAMLGGDRSAEAPPPDLDGAQEQHDAEDELGVFGDRGKERDIRQDQLLDERREQSVVRSWAGTNKRVEIVDEVRIGEFVEPRKQELNPQRRLDQGRRREGGVSTRRNTTNADSWCHRGPCACGGVHHSY